jgi:hypothetical protein
MTNTEPIATEGLLDAARHELDIAAQTTDGLVASHRTRIARQYTRLADLFEEHPDAVGDVMIAVTLLGLAANQSPPPTFGDSRPDWASVADARANIIAAMPRRRQQVLAQMVAAHAAFGTTMIPADGTRRPVSG